MSATRAERRRDLKARQKTTGYAESGFKDPAVYKPFTPTQRTDRRGFDANGNPLPSGPFTVGELHQRAVERRDRRRMIEKLVAEQAKATSEARAERKVAQRAAARKAYLAACGKPLPIKYLHSAARRLGISQPLALAT